MKRAAQIFAAQPSFCPFPANVMQMMQIVMKIWLFVIVLPAETVYNDNRRNSRKTGRPQGEREKYNKTGGFGT